MLDRYKGEVGDRGMSRVLSYLDILGEKKRGDWYGFLMKGKFYKKYLEENFLYFIYKKKLFVCGFKVNSLLFYIWRVMNFYLFK